AESEEERICRSHAEGVSLVHRPSRRKFAEASRIKHDLDYKIFVSRSAERAGSAEGRGPFAMSAEREKFLRFDRREKRRAATAAPAIFSGDREWNVGGAIPEFERLLFALRTRAFFRA